MSEKVKLYFFPSQASEGQDTKKIEGTLYVKRPFKVFVDARPAMLKYTQQINFTDSKDKYAVGQKEEVKAKHIKITGYFKRIDSDSYRQLNPDEVKKVLGWMASNDVKPQDLTLEQMDTAMASKIELDDEPRIVVPDDKKTPGGIVLPG